MNTFRSDRGFFVKNKQATWRLGYLSKAKVALNGSKS